MQIQKRDASLNSKQHVELNAALGGLAKEFVGQSSRSVKSSTKPSVIRRDDLGHEGVIQSHGVINPERFKQISQALNANPSRFNSNQNI
jgi:hypothetical protein